MKRLLFLTFTILGVLIVIFVSAGMYLFNRDSNDSVVTVPATHTPPSTPTETPPAGTYTTTQNVALSSSGATSIRYTKDSTNPTCSTGTVYTDTSKPTITVATTLKVVGCNATGASPVLSAMYTIAPTSTISGYDIIIVAGQSNAVGAGTGPFSDSFASAATDAKIFALGRINDSNGNDNMTVIPATWTNGTTVYDALQHWNVRRRRETVGFSIPFARRYVNEQLGSNRAVLIVPTAYPGTSILKWLGEILTPTSIPNALYDDMLARAQAALAFPGDNKIVAFLWHQGENDVKKVILGEDSMTPALYQTKLNLLIQKLRTDLPSSPLYPVVGGKFTPAWRTGESAKNQIESAMMNAFGADPKGGVVSSAGLTSNPIQVVHFSSASQVIFGSRYYQKWKVLKDGTVPPDTTPPTVALTAPANGATVSGTIPVGATATDNVWISGVQFVKNFFGNFFFGN